VALYYNMDSQSLLQYLSIALPEIPVQGTIPSRNTLNPCYSEEDITQVIDWPEFNYGTVIQRYGGLLNSKQIARDPFSSPPAAIRDTDDHFRGRCAPLLYPRVRRALRARFEELAPQLEQLSLVPVIFDAGNSTAYFNQFGPDTTFIESTYGNSKNRAPGVMKVSLKWRSDYRHSQNPTFQEEYREVLSEVNFYMGQNNVRYGFVLTNTELVAIKRLERNGYLAVSAAIP